MAKKQYSVDDIYTKRAKKSGFRARSYFKLLEIDEKHHIFIKGSSYLDLGAAPGAWTQYILNKTGGNCRVDAVDLQVIKPFTTSNSVNKKHKATHGSENGSDSEPTEVKIVANGENKANRINNTSSGLNKNKNSVVCIKGDVLQLDETLLRSPYCAVVSDMAPATTGNKDADSYESFLLVVAAANLAVRVLQPSGFFLAKYFEGAEMQELRNYLQQYFYKLRGIKPQSSRSNSREVFLLGRLKNNISL